MEGPSEPPAESPVRDKYQCPVCQAEFVLDQSRRRHVRKQHPEAASSLSGSAKASYSCDQCTNVFARRGQLLQHHEQNHGFVSRLSTHQFSSYYDFAAWKETEEMKEQVQFIASSGPKRSSSGVTKMYLLCSRSGMHEKTGEGKRQPKLVGSVKCNKHCFATMDISQEGENVTVEYQAEHYGHDRKMVVSDNGTQFSSSDFAKFAQEYGFKHVTSSPEHPQSNGITEDAVKIMKTSMKKTQDPYLTLLSYRSTPLKNGYSPSELLMARQLRTKNPLTPGLDTCSG
ncbi:uncharacterized protein LOC144119833 [Amblyomma americanum]